MSKKSFAADGDDGRLIDFQRFGRANSLSDVMGSLFLRRCWKRFALTLWGFSNQQRIFLSSAAIKRTCAFLDNRKLLEDSPIHCSSNAGVSGQPIDKQRRFIISSNRGIRGPRLFLRLSSAFATT